MFSRPRMPRIDWPSVHADRAVEAASRLGGAQSGTILNRSELPTNPIPSPRNQMCSRAEEYRRRGIEAKQRAAQANIRLAFEDVARGWFLLAEQANWLDRRDRDAQHDEKD